MEIKQANSKNPTIQNYYPKFSDNENDHSRIWARINRICSKFKVRTGKPRRGATALYLGLCILRDYTENDAEEKGRIICDDIYERYKPNDSGSVSLSTGCFCGDDKHVDHRPAFASAAGVYLPDLNNQKQWAFVFTVLGSTFNEEEYGPIPENENWLESYDF